MKCDYGCGQEAKFKTSNLKNCCSKHYNSCPGLRERNSKAKKQNHKDGVQYTFTDDARQKSIDTRQTQMVESFLSGKFTGTNASIKSMLHAHLGVKEECQSCSITEWQGEKISLELDHINGDSTDNDPSNLRLLCPNCHAITPTWRGRNINSGKVKVSDKDLLTALARCSNIRQALLAVGLAPKGGNYARAKKLIDAGVAE